MKKKTLILSVGLLGSSAFTTFASSSTIANMANVNFKAMDVPLLSGMAYFLKTIDSFANIASTLAIALFFTTILWNAFRLWFGTQQVRKAAIDIMLKCLLFTALVMCYRGIQYGVLELSMKIGATAGGGANELSTAFTDMRNSLESKLSVTRQLLDKALKSAKKNGAVLTEKEVETFAKGMGKTEEEMTATINNYGIQTTTSAGKMLKNDLTGKNGAESAIISWLYLPFRTEIAVAQGIDNSIKVNKIYKGMDDSEKAKMKKMLKNGEGDRLLTLMNAFNDVLIDASEETSSSAKSSSAKSNIKSYLFNPYITLDSSTASEFKMEDLKKMGSGNLMISPGAMIKTSCLIASILFEQVSNETTDGAYISKIFKASTWKSIFNYIILIVMTITLIMSSVFCVIQYSMCLFEYFITTSIGVMFIPCILFDGTKSFASKLITLFVSYFVKITVMLLCLFWTYATYMKVGMSIAFNTEPISLVMFSYLMFTVILGFVVTQNAPQIAVTVLNGSPQLSMGEFLHAAGTLAAGAALAGKTAKNLGGKAAHIADGTGSGLVSGINAAIGTYQGAKGGGASKGQALKQALKSGVSTTGSAWGSGIANSASRLVLGRDVAQNKATSGGFRRGNASSVAQSNEGKWSKEQREQYTNAAGVDGKNSMENVRLAAKFNAIAANKNAPANVPNENGNNQPTDATEKVDQTRQSGTQSSDTQSNA